MSKTEQVKKYLDSGDYKNALQIAKTFRIGVTKEERSEITRAYECIVHPDFYRSIGKDIEACITSGVSILRKVL